MEQANRVGVMERCNGVTVMVVKHGDTVASVQMERDDGKGSCAPACSERGIGAHR